MVKVIVTDGTTTFERESEFAFVVVADKSEHHSMALGDAMPIDSITAIADSVHYFLTLGSYSDDEKATLLMLFENVFEYIRSTRDDFDVLDIKTGYEKLSDETIELIEEKLRGDTYGKLRN